MEFSGYLHILHELTVPDTVLISFVTTPREDLFIYTATNV